MSVHLRKCVLEAISSLTIVLAFITKLIDCKLVNNKWLLNSLFLGNRFSLAISISLVA